VGQSRADREELMTLRGTAKVLGALSVRATVTVCTLYVTKSTAQSAKKGQPEAESNASDTDGWTCFV